MAHYVDFSDGEQVRGLRRNLRLNQASFWAPFGITQSGGSRYESGRDIPEPVVKLLVIAFGSEEAVNQILESFRKISRSQGGN